MSLAHLEVPCPVCGAERGVMCKGIKLAHFARVEAARKADRVETVLPVPWTLVDNGDSTLTLSNGQESWRFNASVGTGTNDNFVYEFLRSLADHAKVRP